MAYTITPPQYLGDKDFVNFFKSWTPETWLARQTSDIVADLSSVEFMAPWAVVLYTNYLLWLKEVRQNRLEVKLGDSSRSSVYAIQSGIPSILGFQPGFSAESQSKDRMSPLTRIQTSDDVPKFAQTVMRLLNVGDEELEGALRYSIIELPRNVVQHSKSRPGGLAMAQYYPKTGLVEVAVADVGIGVLQALKPKYPEVDTDLKALRLSILPHVSGTFSSGAYGSMSDNAGLGLFFIKEIATRSSGGFFFGSGSAMMDLWGNEDGTLGKQYLSSHGEWPGTFAMLQLRRDAIAEFDSLLGVCRELAAAVTKDPSTLSLDFSDRPPFQGSALILKVIEFDENVQRAADIREKQVIPQLAANKEVAWDFTGVRAATQSFVHACMYRVLRDCPNARTLMTICGCTKATKEAIKTVAAYAALGAKQLKDAPPQKE
ncbi:MAG: ATP-binding protein [Elusimicrobia bacterium]|nr:ATP-binding protein [Elusimicrobiota bacterium]